MIMSSRKIVRVKHSALIRFLRRFLPGQDVISTLHVGQIPIGLLLDMAGLLEMLLEGLGGRVPREERVVGCHDKYNRYDYCVMLLYKTIEVPIHEIGLLLTKLKYWQSK